MRGFRVQDTEDASGLLFNPNPLPERGIVFENTATFVPH